MPCHSSHQPLIPYPFNADTVLQSSFYFTGLTGFVHFHTRMTNHLLQQPRRLPLLHRTGWDAHIAQLPYAPRSVSGLQPRPPLFRLLQAEARTPAILLLATPEQCGRELRSPSRLIIVIIIIISRAKQSPTETSEPTKQVNQPTIKIKRNNALHNPPPPPPPLLGPNQRPRTKRAVAEIVFDTPPTQYH